jgi:hypothetical protein
MKYIVRHRDGKTDILDAITGEPVERAITAVHISVKAPGAAPKATVECIDVGFDLTLREESVEFLEGVSLLLNHEERTHIVSALQAVKALVAGGDSRSAMLQLAAVTKEANVQIPRVDHLTRLIDTIRQVQPPKATSPEPEPEQEPEPERKPVEGKREQAPPQVPPIQHPPLAAQADDDPLKGAVSPG